MDNFTNKQINPEGTLGQKLIDQRLLLKLDLSVLAEETGVHKKYFRALEEGDYKSLPPEVYSKNFLRKYLKALHLPEKEHVDLFLKEKKSYEAIHGIKKDKKFIEKISLFNLISAPKILRNSLIVIVAAALLGYLAWQINDITAAPHLQINSPQENITTEKSSIIVEGRAEKEASVSINDEGVSSNPEGIFRKELQLQEGINIIKITAKKKYGDETTIYRTVIVENNN